MHASPTEGLEMQISKCRMLLPGVSRHFKEQNWNQPEAYPCFQYLFLLTRHRELPVQLTYCFTNNSKLISCLTMWENSALTTRVSTLGPNIPSLFQTVQFFLPIPELLTSSISMRIISLYPYHFPDQGKVSGIQKQRYQSKLFRPLNQLA